MKRLSVIIPGYNNPNWRWERAIESVRAAIGVEDEIICVDDGSKTRPQVAIKDARLKWIFLERNGGQAAARNQGIEESQGLYLTFVDSDDEVRPDVYSRMIAKMGTSGCDLGVFGVTVDWEDDGLWCEDRADEIVYGELTPEVVKDLRERHLFNYQCNKIYSRAFINRGDQPLRFDPDGMPCEDVIFNLQCVMRGARWCSIDYQGYKYNHTTRSSLSAYKPRNRIGLENGSAAWAAYKASCPRAREVLGNYGEYTAVKISQMEFKNVSRSTMTFTEKWRWFKTHPELGSVRVFVRMMVFAFLRHHCYVRPIRRWNILRSNPHAKRK